MDSVDGMDASTRRHLSEFRHACAAQDAGREDRLDRWRNLEEDSAEVLGVLARASRAGAILELGTSNGYSTCWLADAARDTGAGVVSVELEADRTERARELLGQVGLADHVELVVADAGSHLRAVASGSVDLVFLDAERGAYVGYWPDLQRVLAATGTLVVDNVVSHADEVAEFVGLVASAGWCLSVVPTGAGVLVATRGAGWGAPTSSDVDTPRHG